MTTHDGILRRGAYRDLLVAQVVALLGTGLLTVALSLLAYDVAPGSAGTVVASVLTIKMVAYVLLAPAVAALTARLRPRTVLVAADVVRLLVAASLPWVDQVWQVYVLVFVLQAGSATFTPTYQALLPAVLPDREDYARALSYSRLAYDLEAVVSPLLAALALLVMSYHGLFVGTAVGFALSALLVLHSRQGVVAAAATSATFLERATAGVRLFARTRELRAVILLDLATAAAMAMVLVNTVVVTRQVLGRGEDDVAIALGVFGAGSMLVALAMPRLLRRWDARLVMLPGSVAVVLGLLLASFAGSDAGTWPAVLAVWFCLGAAASAVLTPVGQVVTDAVRDEERPAAFAAHFSLSHACYLVTYPVAGWVGGSAGLAVAALVLAAVAGAATLAAAITWPAPARTSVAPGRRRS